MPLDFITGTSRAPSHPGKSRGKGGGRGATIRLGPFQFGITLRNFWPVVYGTIPGPPKKKLHPLHSDFVAPTLPGVITACTIQPEACAAVPTIGGPIAIPAGIAAVIGITLTKILEKAQQKRIDEMVRRQEAEIEREIERHRREAIWNRVVVIPPAPDLPPFKDYPAPVPAVARPVPIQAPTPRVGTVADPVPEIAFPSPQPVPLPQIPVFSPQIAPPRPVAAPASPVANPFEFPSPGIRPLPFVGLPLPQPVGQPVPIPGTPTLPTFPGLTAPQPVGVPSRLAEPYSFAQPGTQPGRAQCECPSVDQKGKQRKRRSKCQKGFYRERAGSIVYTPWSRVDCITGREL